ncbi:hypothetical protein U1Q18_011251, partial [Sarracenia purpurea var. burkii]
MVELGITARWGLRLDEGRRSAGLAARRDLPLGETYYSVRVAARVTSGGEPELIVREVLEISDSLDSGSGDDHWIQIAGAESNATDPVGVGVVVLDGVLAPSKCSVGGRLRRWRDGCVGGGRRSGGQWCRLKGPRGGARVVVVPNADDDEVGEMVTSGLGLRKPSSRWRRHCWGAMDGDETSAWRAEPAMKHR